MKSPGTASHKTSGKKAKKDGKWPGKGALGRERRAERREYKGEARREDASSRREEADARHRRAEAAHYETEGKKAEREGYKKEAEYDFAKARREEAEARRDAAKARHHQAEARKHRHKAARVGLALPGAVSSGWILGGNGWHSGCAAVALANHLYAATGLRVSAQDVLGLYRLTADDPAQGASVQATLEAAAEYGLAGIRPVSFHPHAWDSTGCPEGDIFGVDDLDAAALTVEAHALPPVQRQPVLHRPVLPADDASFVGCSGHSVSVILDLRLQRAQRHQPVWDWEPSPDWGAHAGLLASDRVITWGRAVPVTGDFLARQAVGAWRVEWPQAAAQGRAPCHATPGPALPRPA